MKKILLFLGLFLLVSPSVFADSASIGGSGNTVKIMDNNEIEMTSEVINIDVYDGDKYAEGYGWVKGGYAEVDVVYYFKNLTDEAVTVTMGFPEDCGYYCYYERESYEEDTSGYGLFEFYKLSDFTAMDGDQELDVTFRDDATADTEYTNWYIYEVDFAPNEEKMIRNTYWIAPSLYRTGQWYNYILETGASWSGDIGQVDIFVTYHDDISIYDVYEVMPSGYSFDKSDNMIEWHFTDLEPTGDHNISVFHYYESIFNWWCVDDNMWKIIEYSPPTQVTENIGNMVLIEGDFNFKDYNVDEICEEASSCLGPEKYGNGLYMYLSCMADDNDETSSWVEGVDGSGIGEWVEVALDTRFLYERVEIFGGYGEDEQSWEENNRVKKVKITFSDGREEVFDLADTYGFQAFQLSSPITNVEWAKVEIMDVYPGSMYDDTAIAEINFLGLLAEGVVYEESVFPDIVGYIYQDAIEYIAERDIVDGYPDGTYKPNDPVNRAEMTKIIIEAVYPGQAAGANCFPDVKEDWYAQYVCFAKDNNVISGYPDNTFKPADNVNYVEALKIVLEAFGYAPAEESDPWYQKYLDKGEEIGALVPNTENDEKLSRGKMAELIKRVLEYDEG